MAIHFSETQYLLKKARHFLKKRDFSGISHLLTRKVPIFMDNVDLFYYLGLSHFYMKKLKSAEDYFKVGIEKDPEHIDIRLAAAILALKQKQLGRALTLWLDILDIDPVNKKATEGLKFLQEINPDEESSRLFIRHRKLIDKFGPSLPSYLMTKVSFLLLLSFVFCVAISFIFIKIFSHNVWFSIKPTVFIKREGSNLDNLFLNKNKKSLAAEDGKHYFQYSAREILDILNQVKRDFNAYKDNKLRFDLNKMKYSNASAFVKAEIELLRSVLKKPNFSTLDTNYTFREVFSDPLFYNGVFVHWRGKIENIEIGSEVITCDLLVGYDMEQILEGKISVVIPFEIFLDPLLPTEILGEIRSSTNKVIFHATSIHQIIHKN